MTLSEQIKQNADKIAESLTKGNSVEIKRKTDGKIVIYEVRKNKR